MKRWRRSSARGSAGWESEIRRLKGDLILKAPSRPAGSRRPSAADAEECFQQALAVARRQEARSLELRAAMSLVRLRGGHGKEATADRLLKETYDWFTEGFDTADLQEARALLTAGQSHQPGRPPSGRSGAARGERARA